MSIPTVILRTSQLRIRPLTTLLPLLFSMLLAVPHRAAAQINVPHIAVSGAPILASHFNANMSALGSNACNRSNCVMLGPFQGTSGTFSSTLAVSGAVTLNSSLSVSGTTTLASLQSGAITASGNIAPATGATYSNGTLAARWSTVYTGALDASSNVTLSGALMANGNANAQVNHTFTNTNSGNNALVGINLTNDTGGSGVLRMTSSTFTGSPNGLVLNNLVPNGAVYILTNGSGSINYISGTGGHGFSGGNIFLNGGVTLNASANSNTFVTHEFTNTNTGSNALVRLVLTNASGQAGMLQLTGSGWGGGLANDLLLLNGAAGPIRFVTSGAGSITYQSGSAGHTFTGGRVNSNSSQPGFLCFNSTDDTHSAGTSTIDCDSEVYDQTGSFAADTFTAPVPGTYVFCATLRGNSGVPGGGAAGFQLVTSNRSYRIGEQSAGVSQDHSGCVMADMDASDTASLQVSAGGQVSVHGSGSPYYSYFSGRLIL